MEASEVIKYQTTEAIVGGFICLAVIGLLGFLALRAYKLYLANEKKHRDNDLRDVYKLIRTVEKTVEENKIEQTRFNRETNLTLDSLSSVHSNKEGK